jgi:hypothetical protein
MPDRMYFTVSINCANINTLASVCIRSESSCGALKKIFLLSIQSEMSEMCVRTDRSTAQLHRQGEEPTVKGAYIVKMITLRQHA